MIGLGGGSLAKFIYHRLPRDAHRGDRGESARRGDRAQLLSRARGRRALRGDDSATAPNAWRGRAGADASSSMATTAMRTSRSSASGVLRGLPPAARPRRHAGRESVGRRPPFNDVCSASRARFPAARCACRPRSRATSSCSASRTPRGAAQWEELARGARARGDLRARIRAFRARAAQDEPHDASASYMWQAVTPVSTRRRLFLVAEFEKIVDNSEQHAGGST